MPTPSTNQATSFLTTAIPWPGSGDPSPLPLYIDSEPVLTVQVIPHQVGVILPTDPPNNTLTPGASATTVSNIIVSLADAESISWTNAISTTSTASSTPNLSSTTAPTPITSISQAPSNTQQPAPTISPTSNAKSSNGLSGGAVAGVAIGCLLGGALISALIAWFFFKRRKSSGVRDSEASSMALINHEKRPKAKTVSLESGSPIAAALENGLPLPLEDKAITGEISKISNLIKNHVQSYYHAGRLSPVVIDYDDLQALGSDIPVSVGTLSTLLGNSATREIALRFCIAWIVVSRMQINSPPNTTFLPPEISQCFQAMTLVGHGSRMHATYFAKWRAITAELMQSTYVRNPFSATDGRLYNLQAAADLLNNVLRPYSDSRLDDGQRSQNLEEILKRSALFAFTLFSQPSTWIFDWQNKQDVKSGSLCIFPALLLVKDENGVPINPPRPFSEAVVRRLDE